MAAKQPKKGVFSPGDKLGKYRMEELLGAGGMGEVYLARDDYLDRQVAIEVLPLTRTTDKLFQERMKREAAAGARLDHPNVVKVIDGGVTDGVVYVVMEYLGSHRTLRDVIHFDGRLPPYQLLRVVLQIADGVAAIHALSITHRDLKPENVVLLKNGRAKIIDLGLARIRTDLLRTTAKDERRLMTPLYAAPEQVGGPSDAITEKADIWSVGAIMYELATGKQIWSAVTAEMPSPQEATWAMQNRDPARLREVSLELPPGFARLVDRCLDRDPRARPDAVELLTKLRHMFGLVPAPTVTDEMEAVARAAPPSRASSSAPHDTMETGAPLFRFETDLSAADREDSGSAMRALKERPPTPPVATTAPVTSGHKGSSAARDRVAIVLGAALAAVVIAMTTIIWWIAHKPGPANDATFPMPSTTLSSKPSSATREILDPEPSTVPTSSASAALAPATADSTRMPIVPPVVRPPPSVAPRGGASASSAANFRPDE